jgi:hypothetical protein
MFLNAPSKLTLFAYLGKKRKIILVIKNYKKGALQGACHAVKALLSSFASGSFGTSAAIYGILKQF